MLYTNSPLVDYIKLSPNHSGKRKHEIDTISIHCVVGQCSVETLGSIFAPESRQASCNYGVGYDGRIGMYVEEKNRSWCTSSASNDHRAITIEVASDMSEPYAVNDRAYASLIKLVADICKRNNIKELKWQGDKSLIGQTDKQNMTVHRWFANKSCPGNYLYNLHGRIANEVNAILKGANATQFPDVPGHYAENHINKLISYDVIAGYEDGTFKPDKPVTRAEFSTMVVKALEKACGYTLKSVAAFSDISGHWAEDIIKKLVACGIVNGFEDGTFRPDQAITRGQAAIIACHMLTYCGVGMESADSYPDTIGHYAERHINTLKAFGVVNGFEDGTFKPEQEITRGQAAMYVANCLTVLGK